MREAVRALTAIGAVDVAQGNGMYVAGGESSLLARPLAWSLLMSDGTADEVIVARRTVETELASLAAAAAASDEIVAIGQALDALQAEPADVATFGERDLAFHVAIARAAHNRVLFHVFETLRHLVQAWIVERLRAAEGDAPAEHAQAIAEHLPIYEAIRARDARSAREAMAQHLNAAGARLLAVVAQRPAE